MSRTDRRSTGRRRRVGWRALVTLAVIALVLVTGAPMATGSAASAAAPAHVTAVNARPVLRQGSRGAAVTTLQTA
jgi:hypothetical protein